MKEFKFIVTETETGNNIVFENKDYSWFEIYGFAKYIKIQTELKIAEISKNQDIKVNSPELTKSEEPKPKTKSSSKVKVEEKPKESIAGKDNVATFEGNANESFVTPIDKLGMKTETKVAIVKTEVPANVPEKKDGDNKNTDGELWF